MTPKEKQFILERVENALAEIEKHSGRAERKIKRLLLEIRNECEHANEAVLVREQVRETTGNAAKMREALEKMRDFMDAMNSSQEPIEYGEYSWAVDTIDDALSAPPRNCDRFGSWREANAEWWKYEVLPRVEGVVSGTEQPFEEWLFAKAKESLNK